MCVCGGGGGAVDTNVRFEWHSSKSSTRTCNGDTSTLQTPESIWINIAIYIHTFTTKIRCHLPKAKCNVKTMYFSCFNTSSCSF